MTGTLYIVATPIGNLSDISKRAEQVLYDVDLIAAEDSRHARTLLDQVGFKGKVVAYHDFSDQAKAQQLIDKLQSGQSIALISDAGTPLISDPGYKLVRAAREHDLMVIPIPGPSAVSAALSVAGLPTDRFSFEGFLPSKKTARQKQLATLVNESRTLVFFESTHRIEDCLVDMSDAFGESRVVFLAREMTKKFEQHFLGSLKECIDWLKEDDLHKKGEFVLVVDGVSESETSAQNYELGMELVKELRHDVSLKRAVALAAKISGARKNELYDAALKLESGPSN